MHILFCRHIWAKLSRLFWTFLSGTFFPGGGVHVHPVHPPCVRARGYAVFFASFVDVSSPAETTENILTTPKGYSKLEICLISPGFLACCNKAETTEGIRAASDMKSNALLGLVFVITAVIATLGDHPRFDRGPAKWAKHSANK